MAASVAIAAVLGRVFIIWTQFGATMGPFPARYTDGVLPTISRANVGRNSDEGRIMPALGVYERT